MLGQEILVEIRTQLYRLRECLITTDTRDAQDILAEALALSPQEQHEVLQGLVESPAQTFSPLERVAASFWTQRSIEDLAREQRIPVVTDLQALAVPEWPSDETANDLISYAREQRHTDATAE
jgi:hypothetical protein